MCAYGRLLNFTIYLKVKVNIEALIKGPGLEVKLEAQVCVFIMGNLRYLLCK